MRIVFQRLPVRMAALGLFAALTFAIVAPLTAMQVSAAASAPSSSCTTVQCVIQFGDMRIAERLTSLSNLNTKVSARLTAGRITADQAAPIQSDVTNDTNGLNQLKTKLDAETDIQAARQDVKNIYAQFRVYAVVLPRDYRRVALAVMVNIDTKLKNPTLIGKIQYAINHAPTSEQAQLNTLFSDYKAQLSEGESMIDAAQGQLGTLTVANFNNDRTVYESAFSSYKSDEQSAHKSIHQAATDLHQIAQILKGNGASASPTTTSAS